MVDEAQSIGGCRYLEVVVIVPVVREIDDSFVTAQVEHRIAA